MPVSIRDDYPHMSAAGGQCYCCGAGRRDVRDPDMTLHKERVVDLGVSIDMEGYLCICETCVREAAGLLGMIVPDQRDAALRSLADVELENGRLRQERDEAKQFARVVIDYREREVAEAVSFFGATPVPVPRPMLIQVSAETARQAAEDRAATEADGAAAASLLPAGPVEVVVPDAPVAPAARKTKARQGQNRSGR